MCKYNISLKECDKPKYIQIYEQLKLEIEQKKFDDGEALMPIRVLSSKLKVNCDTIVGAYKKLANEGFAFQKMGSGTFAKVKGVRINYKKKYSDILKKISYKKNDKYVDFTGETSSSVDFPVSVFKKVIDDVLDRDGTKALVCQEELGYRGLIESINSYFWNGNLDCDSLLIVTGAQMGIDAVSKAIVGINDNVVVEKPTYSGALSVFRFRRANIFQLDMNEGGIDVKKLENILKKNKIKCFYTMSYFQNPTTYTYSLENKKRILELAELYDFYIIEDDYLSELIYDPSVQYNSFKSMDTNDRVIYIKSFSKIFLPGIRIGYLISPSVFKEGIQNSKINTDISTSSLMQRVLDEYIRKDLWQEHIKTLKDEYGKRYSYMGQYLKDKFNDIIKFKPPDGGLNFYIKINDNVKIDCMELFNRCIEYNVLITPGVIFYINEDDGKKYFRLSFSQTNIVEIKKGLDIIYDILKQKMK